MDENEGVVVLSVGGWPAFGVAAGAGAEPKLKVGAEVPPAAAPPGAAPNSGAAVDPPVGAGAGAAPGVPAPKTKLDIINGTYV